jgi:hypothetical protein
VADGEEAFHFLPVILSQVELAARRFAPLHNTARLTCFINASFTKIEQRSHWWIVRRRGRDWWGIPDSAARRVREMPSEERAAIA